MAKTTVAGRVEQTRMEELSISLDMQIDVHRRQDSPSIVSASDNTADSKISGSAQRCGEYSAGRLQAQVSA